MPGILDLLAGIVGPQQQAPNQLAAVGNIAPSRFDGPGMFSDPGVQAALAGMRQNAPQLPAQAQQAPQAIQGQPMPQRAPAAQSGGNGGPLGGIGDFLGDILMPQRSAKNRTVQWLQQQGMDEGTATLLAGNKNALQSYLLQRTQGADPKEALQLEKLGLEIEQMRNPTTDDIREYQFARQNGYEGTFADWRAGGASKPSAIQEYEYAKQQGFPGTFQDWEASKKGGMSLQVDPATGAVTFQQGGNIKPMTEAQSKDAVFATRAEGALKVLDGRVDPNDPQSPYLSDSLTSLPEAVGGKTPMVGNYMKSPEYQRAEQAGLEFLQAILRKDTGAAITSQEQTEYGRVYLPQPGDGPQVLEQKRQSRQRALEALKAGMPPQAILAQEKALSRGQQTPTEEQYLDQQYRGTGRPGSWRDVGGGVKIRRVQ